VSCCAGDAWGVADGELAGIGIPGVCIWGEATGEGEAVGLCMLGVITCGVGVGDGFGRVARRVVVRRVRGAALFFVRAVFGVGLLAGFIFGVSCP
jgi:hypothetical protein